MRLLVVEDEHSLREDIARKLRLSGYEVDACADGEAALEALAAERYDLVLLDLNLPKVDGMQVLRSLRQHDLETCVLILSARSEISDKVEGLDAGAHFFDTVFRPEGLLWIAAGFVLTVVPVLIVGVVAFKWMKVDFGSMAGMLCGSMANPMALNYANDTIPGDNPSVAYATVYPMCMFLRVIIAQVLLMFLLN